MRVKERSALLAAGLLALTSIPGRALAQDFPAIRMGQAQEDALQESDPTLTDRGRFKVYRFNAVAGTRYVISLQSEDFDPYVSVARVVGGITDVVDGDDDGGDGTNARMRWSTTSSGPYLLIAQSFAAEGTGRFRLSIAEAPQPTTAAPRPIAAGAEVSGSLAETDAVLEDDDSFYDTYTLRGTRGQRLVIEMRSDSIDTYLTFGRMQGDDFEALRNDDDGLEGTDSRLRFTVPEDGEYVIRANSVGGGETGPYTLVVRERPAPPAPVAQALRPGSSASGEISDSDAVLDDEEVFYDLYSVQGSPGQRVQVDMESAAFDAYLEAGDTAGGTWQSRRIDDDSGDGTNARLRFTLPASGAMLLRARAFSESGTGAYSVAARLLPAPRPASPQPIALGQSINGRLDDTDALLPDEEIQYDAYTITLGQGQRISLEMRSDSFDTYLELGQMRDGAWQPLRTDDDGMEGSTDSRVRFTAEEEGVYMVRTRSYSPGATGPYTLVAIERESGPASLPRPIRAGEEVRGALEDSDAELPDASFYDVYTYAGHAGEELTITLASDAFDTFLHAGRMVDGRYEEIATNDDGDDGTNSRLVVRLTEDGEYVIRANSLRPSQTGEYRLQVATSRDR